MSLNSQPTLTQDPDGSFEKLAALHRAAFQRLARRLARDPEDAEDLLQETLIDAYRAFGRFRANSHFYNWVARIMTNNHLDRVRRKHHPVVSLEQASDLQGTETLDLPDERANPERVLLEDALDGPLQSALDILQPHHRATVLLCDIDGATYQEAAAAEQCPVGTIRSRLNRAHHALRKFLAGIEAPPAAEPPIRLHSRRAFLRFGTAAATAAFAGLDVEEALAGAGPLRVLVWSDGSAPRDVYPDGVHGAVAEGLGAARGIEVRVATIADPQQGLADNALRDTDVLIWWGASRQQDVRPGRAAAVARRVRDGMGLIALHDSAGCLPLRAVLDSPCGWAGGTSDNASPVEVRTTAPRHPIARGLDGFRIARTEACRGPLDAPQPDVVVFDGTYSADGGTAWHGVVWTRGRGRVFYFQPGHETYPIFHQEEVRQVLRNAAYWCGHRPAP